MNILVPKEVFIIFLFLFLFLFLFYFCSKKLNYFKNIFKFFNIINNINNEIYLYKEPIKWPLPTIFDRQNNSQALASWREWFWSFLNN